MLKKSSSASHDSATNYQNWLGYDHQNTMEAYNTDWNASLSTFLLPCSFTSLIKQPVKEAQGR